MLGSSMVTATEIEQPLHQRLDSLWFVGDAAFHVVGQAGDAPGFDEGVVILRGPRTARIADIEMHELVTTGRTLRIASVVLRRYWAVIAAALWMNSSL